MKYSCCRFFFVSIVVVVASTLLAVNLVSELLHCCHSELPTGAPWCRLLALTPLRQPVPIVARRGDTDRTENSAKQDEPPETLPPEIQYNDVILSTLRRRAADVSEICRQSMNVSRAPLLFPVPVDVAERLFERSLLVYKRHQVGG